MGRGGQDQREGVTPNKWPLIAVLSQILRNISMEHGQNSMEISMKISHQNMNFGFSSIHVLVSVQ